MSLEIKAIVTGTEEVIRKMKLKDSQMRAAFVKAIKESAILVEGDCKRSMAGTGTPHIPSKPGEPPAVMTGKLRASITHEVKAGQEMEAKVGIRGGTLPDTKNYGLFLEFGTSKMQRRPYLRPALEKNMQTIVDKIKDAVKAAIK